jgi:hypothetical protein
MTYKTVSMIKRKGYPTNSPSYPEAHEEADNAEKKKYPKGYEKLKKQRIKPGELMGTHTCKGKVTVSKKVAKSLRSEVAYHERQELKAQKRLRKK